MWSLCFRPSLNTHKNCWLIESLLLENVLRNEDEEKTKMFINCSINVWPPFQFILDMCADVSIVVAICQRSGGLRVDYK